MRKTTFLLVALLALVVSVGCRSERKSGHKTTFHPIASREYFQVADLKAHPAKLSGHLTYKQAKALEAEGKDFFIGRFDKERRLLGVEQRRAGQSVLRVDYEYTAKGINELKWTPK